MPFLIVCVLEMGESKRTVGLYLLMDHCILNTLAWLGSVPEGCHGTITCLEKAEPLLQEPARQR